MPGPTLAAHVSGVRRFSRFYTRRIGVLEQRLLGSPFSLTEGRVLYELAQRDQSTAGAIGALLGLDAGYLSRLLRGFERKGLIARRRATHDGRQALVTLTAAGRRAFGRLDARSRDDVTAMLREVPARERRTVTSAMTTIERALERPAARSPHDDLPPFVLRPHRPGDMGWVVHRHGVLYDREYGWDERFEALVARIAARFIDRLDPARERCWIAERHGEPVGCVFLVRRSAETAQLRLLLVEPSARGLGLGRRLVEVCLAFARQAGYRRVMLWTNDGLDAARRVYVAEGFRLVKAYRHTSFGHRLVGQIWEIRL
jgi:DNA-binding MarR family transcriptional regulator/GNAT superfamily N-acetyltransferase